jgi:Fe-S cluster biogenesis protein NfuA
MSKKYEVFYEATPNPNSMKFNVTSEIASESVYFDDPTKTLRSPLAQKLFGFPWTESVFIGPTFVTVTKQNWVDWSVIADPLSDLLAEHLEREEGVLIAATEENFETSTDDENDSAIVKQIKDILNREIRPAVAMDGGDIIFSRYENNRLYLQMQGACSGCPSSQITLKEGIEVRLKEIIPEIVEVISI